MPDGLFSVDGEKMQTSVAISLPGSPLGVAAGFLYGYQGTPAFSFMPALREIGAGLSKIYVFWNQIEPEPGKFSWDAVDNFVGQLNSPEEGLIAIFSSSTWATRQCATMLPPSPAKNPDEYYRVVLETVKRYAGRVRYWQNDAEPNNPIYWAGSKEEFVTQLKLFYRAVKDADSEAVVVVGGYDGLFGPPGTHQFPNQQAGLNFFDYVLREGCTDFDLFDMRIYGDPYTICARVEIMREKMRAQGFEKAVICTEYGGPNLFEFAENRTYIPVVVAWSQAVVSGNVQGEEASGLLQPNPVEALYAEMSTLAPQTRMFMQGCEADLEEKYQRIQARSLVMRNLLALSCGVQKTIYWDLPRMSLSGQSRNHIMALMYGKVGLFEFADGQLGSRTTSAQAFARMSRTLRGVRQVRRIELIGKPEIFLFEVQRHGSSTAYVVWERRDAFSGEELPATALEFPWRYPAATAADALGHVVPTTVQGGVVRLAVSLTPIFLEPLDIE